MKKSLKYIIICCSIIFLLLISINFYVKISTKNKIVDLSTLKDIDYILVLGAGVWGDEPSPMLKDRLDTAIKIYKNSPTKIIVSGDEHENYSEVNIMKTYLIENGIPDYDILLDGEGYSTYESVYNVKKRYKAKNIVIITQKYHLYRAIYISNNLKINAYGISATTRKYSGDTYREIREILARIKDFIKCLI